MIVKSNSNMVYVPQMPVGIPFPWFTEDRPDGTIVLEGQAFLATDYPELAKIYPSLKLPDMRGVVPRGMDMGRGLNPDASGLPVSSYQGDELNSHTHIAHVPSFVSGVVGTNSGVLANAIYNATTNTDSTGGTETRGKAILCYWICYVRSMYYDLSVEGGNAYLLGGHPSNYYASKTDLVNAQVIQQPWQSPTFLNGWSDYGNIYNPTGYYKDSIGIVHLKGLVKNGTISTTTTGTIFMLPIGYRPHADSIFIVNSNNSIGRCDVDNLGNVIAYTGGNNWFSLDGISFRVEG